MVILYIGKLSPFMHFMIGFTFSCRDFNETEKIRLSRQGEILIEWLPVPIKYVKMFVALPPSTVISQKSASLLHCLVP